MTRKRRYTFIGVLILIVILVWWRWPQDKPVDPKHPHEVSTRHLNDDDIRLRLGTAPTGATDPAEIEPIQPLEPREKWTASVSLLVIDTDTQQPIPGVKVKLVGPILLPPAWSNADGAVEFNLLPSGPYLYSLIHDVYAGPATRFGDDFQLRAGEHKELLVEMSKSCLASGRILDARTGKPIDGVRVYPDRYEEMDPVLTDAAGRFEVATGETNQVSFFLQGDGLSPQELIRGCRDGRIELGDVVMTSAWTLTGQVVDPDRKAIAGATVQDYPADPVTPPPANQIQAVSDAEGRFRLTGLPSTDEIIYFYKDGYASTTASVNAGIREDSLMVTMRPACTLVGKVVDEKDQPLEGVTIIPEVSSEFMGFMSAITDPDGAFRLADVEPGPQNVNMVYLHKGIQIFKRKTVECAKGEKPETLTLDLGMDVMASGTVLNVDGEPVAGAIVYATGPKDWQDGMPSLRFSKSDSDGRFNVAAPSEGAYTLTAIWPGKWQAASKSDLSGPQENIELRLAKRDSFHGPSDLSGTVVDADGQPIVNYTYCWGHCLIRRPADEAGRWKRDDGAQREFPPLWIFLADGRLARYAAIFNLPEGEEAQVAVGPGASVSGTLGASFPAGLTKIEVKQRGTLIERLTENDFSFPLVPPGEYVLVLTASNGLRQEVDFTVDDGQPVDLGEIDLP
ncbi:MAG: hypothetical protein C4523_04100 [Myxococcales bacterium]|nr:MAG: hypothetical protein C4523_04100 [Myxococcales bacterium]